MLWTALLAIGFTAVGVGMPPVAPRLKKFLFLAGIGLSLLSITMIARQLLQNPREAIAKVERQGKNLEVEWDQEEMKHHDSQQNWDVWQNNLRIQYEKRGFEWYEAMDAALDDYNPVWASSFEEPQDINAGQITRDGLRDRIENLDRVFHFGDSK